MLALESGLTVTNNNFSFVLSHSKAARLVLAVPHDGLIANDFSGMFLKRTCGPIVRDLRVWPIANEIVQKCLEQGICVDAVRFLMNRSYVDANREMSGEPNLDPDTLGQTAFDDPVLRSVYQTYRNELCRLIERSVEMFGNRQVLLLDLHGFSHQPETAPPEGYDLILGTAYRKSILHGKVDQDFASFMEERGYRVFLPKESPVTLVGDMFNAGHTTRWFSKEYAINAMQVEIESKFRRQDGRVRGEKLVADIAKFVATKYA